MKVMKKIISALLILVVAISLFGCGEDSKKNSSDMSVYYINKAGDELVTEEYRAKYDNVNNQISDLLDALSKDGSEKDNLAAVPSEVIVNGFKLENGIITVDFDKSYSQMNNQREVLCRAAVVLTLIQINAVDGIAFTINDKPYEKIPGTVLGTMNASSFVSSLKGPGDEFAKSDFLLYFANKDGTRLKKYQLTDANYGDKTKEEFIVESIIQGPNKSGYLPTLSKNIKLKSVLTANNICYVDFDETFLNEHSGVEDEVCIYSIVNSLCELNDIHEVQITVNKEADVMYHKKIDLNEPFIRNLDLVEKE